MPPQPQQTREQFIEGLFNLVPEDNFDTGKHAVKRLIKGIDKGIEILGLAFGSAGANAVIETFEYPFYRTSNDGKLLLKDIKLKDPIEQIGLNMLKAALDKSDRESGDARKTTGLLIGAIIKEGLKSTANPVELRNSLNECLPIIKDTLDGQTKLITPHEVGKVAAVASESETLGKLFQEIYMQIGSDGIVELDNSGTPDTYYELGEGVKLHGCKFTYPYMANEDKQRKAIYKNPLILITKEPLNNIKVLDAILKKVHASGKEELVIFCEDIDLKTSTGLAFLHAGQTPDGKVITPFKTLVIKMPTIWKDWLYEDISKITGATIIDPKQGSTLNYFKMDYLGTCGKIITDKEMTKIIGIKDISEHIEKLNEDGTDDSQIRIARLKTLSATLFVGANSENELSYVKGKALDGRNSSFLALQSGIIPGAGQSLLKVAKALPDTVGGKILKEALKYPYSKICENLSVPETTKFDVSDASSVIKNAVINAISEALTTLTSKAVITLPKK